jgi:hypothetical protein
LALVVRAADDLWTVQGVATAGLVPLLVLAAAVAEMILATGTSAAAVVALVADA